MKQQYVQLFLVLRFLYIYPYIGYSKKKKKKIIFTFFQRKSNINALRTICEGERG
jgi:hypothetical protein